MKLRHFRGAWTTKAFLPKLIWSGTQQNATPRFAESPRIYHTKSRVRRRRSHSTAIVSLVSLIYHLFLTYSCSLELTSVQDLSLCISVMSDSPTVKPAIVLVHGAWHVPEHYSDFIQHQQQAGFEVYYPRLPTCEEAKRLTADMFADAQVVPRPGDFAH